MKNRIFTDIDQKFEQTWALLALEAKNNKIADDSSELSIKRLMGCLKWCTAYSAIQTECKKIIAPYHKQTDFIIKWFWIEYNEMHDFSDLPPTPTDFFEWYCNSYTIETERKIYPTKQKGRKNTVAA